MRISLRVFLLGVLFCLLTSAPFSRAQFFGGGASAYLLQPGTVASSSAFDAAPGTDTILATVTEGGLLHSLLFEVLDATVTGVPEINLLLTVDGVLRTIPLYDGAATFETWLQSLSQSAGGSGGLFSYAPAAAVKEQVSLTTPSAPHFEPVVNVTESGILNGIRFTVGVNVTDNGSAALRVIADGVTQDVTLYDTSNAWETANFSTIENVGVVSGDGTTAGDSISMVLHIPYRNTLQVGLNRTVDHSAGRLDFEVARSTAVASSGGDGSAVGNVVRVDLNSSYLKSLQVQIARAVAGTSAATLRVTVIRSTRI